MAFIKVFSGNSFEVERVKLSLQEQGIEPIIKDISESARLAGFGTLRLEKEVFVHSDQEQQVKEILSSLK
ncbi:putative signal transducing protein [Wenyingzhuangia sp. IMCC45467]